MGNHLRIMATNVREVVKEAIEDGDAFILNTIGLALDDAATEIAQLKHRIKEIETAKTAVEDTIKQTMLENRVLQCGAFKVKNCPESVQVDDEASIPEEFFTTKVAKALDKKLVKEHLQTYGPNSVPGACLVRNKKVDCDSKKLIIE